MHPHQKPALLLYKQGKGAVLLQPGMKKQPTLVTALLTAFSAIGDLRPTLQAKQGQGTLCRTKSLVISLDLDCFTLMCTPAPVLCRQATACEQRSQERRPFKAHPPGKQGPSQSRITRAQDTQVLVLATLCMIRYLVIACAGMQACQ
jgi:hypothetical protein